MSDLNGDPPPVPQRKVPLDPATAFALGAIAMTLPAAIIITWVPDWRAGLMALGASIVILTLIPLEFSGRSD